MKLEKINDNQIRCTLTREDLEMHQVNLRELAYGSEKAKKLFRDMMQQAQIEFGFEADNIPLMIEAIPVNLDSIILIITKVEDPEELTKEFIKGRQYELIYKYYMKYRSKGRWDFAVHADMRSRWQRNSAVAIFRRQLYTAIQTASMLLREVKQ